MNTSPKVALITGANKGIGLEVARKLGQAGLTILVGARDTGRGEEAAATLRREGLAAQFLQVDVTDKTTIDLAAQSIEREFGRLDVLVNNAGIAIDLAAPGTTDLDKMHQTFATNVFGVVALTQALLPLLKKSEAGRIVNTSSELGSLTLASDEASEIYGVEAFSYRASKSALNAFTVALAKELKDTPIKVNSNCPGFTATDLTNHLGPGTPDQGAREATRLALLPEDGPTGKFFNEAGPIAW